MNRFSPAICVALMVGVAAAAVADIAAAQSNEQLERDRLLREKQSQIAQFLNMAAVTYLIGKGADVNLVDNRCGNARCRAAIHQAAYVRAYGAFTALVDAGADVNQQDETGMSGLHWAVYSFNPAIVELVLRHGGDAKLKDEKGRTPRELAQFLLGPEEYGRIAAPQLHKIIDVFDNRRL